MQLKRKINLNSSVIGPLAAMILVFILVSITTNRFFQADNMRNISLQVCIVALMAIGSTAVILIGGIDVSPGSMIALLTMILATLIKFWGLSVPVTIVVILILGCLLGAINGILVALLRIPAFIATLATASIYRGIAFMFNNGSPIFQVSRMLEPVFYGTIVGIPIAFIYIIVFFTLAYIFFRYTKTGREIYAVGGNASASRLSGINVGRIQVTTFVIAGFMAAVSAVLMSARLNSGSPNYGVGMEMSAIAAAVIGGTSLSGGHGNIISTLIGALTIVIVQNGLNLNSVPTSMQNITIGVIIILAVSLDMWRGEIGRVFSGISQGKSAVK